MTPKQKRFCEEYLIDCNATRAAIRAGYSEKTAKSTGQRMLTFVDLKTYIDEQLERLRNEKTADAQEVMEYLSSVMRGEQTEQVLKGVGEGVQEVMEMEVSARVRLKAAELIGRRYGLFSDRIGVDGAVPIVITGADELED